MHRFVLRFALSVACVLVSSACTSDAPQLTAAPWAESERVRVHAPDLSGLGRQQDLYLLEFKTPGEAPVVRTLIDAGNHEEMLEYGVPYLQRQGVKHLDYVYISHPHKDHYGGLSALLDAGITVGELVMNPPLQAPCDSEIPWGCDMDHVIQTIAYAEANGAKHQTLYVNNPHEPVTLWAQDGVELAMWFAPSGQHPVLGELSINDTSLFMRLQVGDVVYAFTGDMNVTEGDFLLAELGDKLKADVLKLPHHGAEGTVSNGFLAAVDPVHHLAPSDPGLWCSPRSQRLRDWMAKRGVQGHVMGLEGGVLVRHFTDREPEWEIDKPLLRTCEDHLANVLPLGSFERLAFASAPQAEPVPADKPVWAEFWHSVDQLRTVEWAGVPALQVRGWKISHDEAARTYAPGLALMNLDDGTLTVFSAQSQARHDVLKHFSKFKLSPEDVGFDQVLPTDGLALGRYELALVSHQYPKWLAMKTGRTLTVGPGGVVVD